MFSKSVQGLKQGFPLPQSWMSEVSPCRVFYHCVGELEPCAGGSQPSSATVPQTNWAQSRRLCSAKQCKDWPHCPGEDSE